MEVAAVADLVEEGLVELVVVVVAVVAVLGVALVADLVEEGLVELVVEVEVVAVVEEAVVAVGEEAAVVVMEVAAVVVVEVAAVRYCVSIESSCRGREAGPIKVESILVFSCQNKYRTLSSLFSLIFIDQTHSARVLPLIIQLACYSDADVTSRCSTQ